MHSINVGAQMERSEVNNPPNLPLVTSSPKLQASLESEGHNTKLTVSSDVGGLLTLCPLDPVRQPGKHCDAAALAGLALGDGLDSLSYSHRFLPSFHFSPLSPLWFFSFCLSLSSFSLSLPFPLSLCVCVHASFCLSLSLSLCLSTSLFPSSLPV